MDKFQKYKRAYELAKEGLTWDGVGHLIGVSGTTAANYYHRYNCNQLQMEWEDYLLWKKNYFQRDKETNQPILRGEL